jgi:hypothetical protein
VEPIAEDTSSEVSVQSLAREEAEEFQSRWTYVGSGCEPWIMAVNLDLGLAMLRFSSKNYVFYDSLKLGKKKWNTLQVKLKDA